MVKKGKAPTSKKSEMTPLFTDTTCNRDVRTSTWETMYQLLEGEQLRILETIVTVDGRISSDATLTELACSFLHRISTRPKILPYTDMVKWIIDDVYISDKELKTTSQEFIGSFTPDKLRLMYHLPEPQAIYNRQSVEKFTKENEDQVECMKNWSNNEERLKKDKNGMYTTDSLSAPFYFSTAMLCRLFGKPDNTKFLLEWLPLIDAAVNTTIMNWA